MEQKFQLILKNSFLLRVEHKGRLTHKTRVVEVTYYWDGLKRIILSGYPGRRDWVANMSENHQVLIYTVEGSDWYQISGVSQAIRNRFERNQYILKYIDRWNNLPGNKKLLISLIIKSIQIKEKLRIPWWGPFYLVQKIFDKMPCIEIVITGEPQRNYSPPPVASPVRQ